MSTTDLDIDLIRIDGDTQPRQSISNETVAEYAEEMQDGDQFPEVIVYFDGKDHWLADGFHRWHAARRIGQAKIRANVIRGTKEDARWHAFGANRAHGLRRTNPDKARAVKLALAHPKAAGMSSREIAKHVGVSHATVDRWRERSGRKSAHSGGGTKCQSSTQVLVPQGAGDLEIDSDSIPMGDDGEVIQEAERFILNCRDRNYPDERIAIMARMRPEPMRSQILSILGEIEPSPGPEPEAEPEPGVPTDRTGRPLPARLRPDFERRDEITKLMSLISQIKTAVLDKNTARDPLYIDMVPSGFKAECENVYRSLRALRPHAICVYCAGDGCNACLDRGWLGEFAYAQAPEDMKHAV